jgi:hypothetical protein
MQNLNLKDPKEIIHWASVIVMKNQTATFTEYTAHLAPVYTLEPSSL